jgi:hypothetical protein
MGEFLHVLSDEIFPGDTENSAESVVDFQGPALEIVEQRSGHAVLERESEALPALGELLGRSVPWGYRQRSPYSFGRPLELIVATRH